MSTMTPSKLFAYVISCTLGFLALNTLAGEAQTAHDIFSKSNPFDDLVDMAKNDQQLLEAQAKQDLYDACRHGTLQVFVVSKRFGVYLEEDIPITESDIAGAVRNAVGNDDLDYPFVAEQVAQRPAYKVYQQALELAIKNPTTSLSEANKLSIEFFERCQKFDYKDFVYE